MSMRRRLLSFVSIFVIFSMLFSEPSLSPALAQGPDGIERRVNTQTGKVSFLGGEDGTLVPADKALGTVRPQDPAMALARRFGPEFGLTNPEQELSTLKSKRTEDGRITARYQQNYQGIPVMGGELMVNTNDNGDLYSMNGEVSPDLALSTQPAITAEQAKQIALRAVAKWYGKSSNEFVVSEPALWIYDESLLRPSTRPAELVWRMDVTPNDAAMPVRELVLVNAQRGGVSLHFNQVDTAWSVPAHVQPAPETTTLKDSALSDWKPTRASTGDPMPALLGATWYVATTGNDSNSCLSAGSPCATINGAIGKASAGDVIRVAVGTYAGTSTEVVLLNKGVTLSGGWDSGFTSQTGRSTIDAQNARRGVVVSAATSLDRFVIQNGDAKAPTLNELGGGVYVTSDVAVTFTNSVIQNNNAQVGGGILTQSGSQPLTLNNSVVSNNSAFSAAGINAGPLILNNSAIYGNAASSTGGGINVYGTNLTVNNSTVSNNSAGFLGGGIYAHTSSVTLNNTTVGRNFSADSGGGVYMDGPTTSNIRNSIIGSNSASTGPDCFGPLTSNGYNLLGNTSGCTVTIKPGDKFNMNPALATLVQGTLPLLPGSPAINAGNAATCLPADQRGAARVGTCDMGAFEYQGNGTTAAFVLPYSGTPQYVTPGAAASSVLKAVVLDADGDTVAGKSVTFTAPVSGPSAVFASTGARTATYNSDGSGIATTSSFSGNSQLGSYVIQATVSGAAGPANFSMTNLVQRVKTYTANNGTTVPGTLLCDQTQPNCTNGANPHADAAHRYALGANALYASQHGRNSINNAGMVIVSSVHYDSSYDNASWDGSQMIYGDAYGFALADDVVAHELTHGVTQYESNLFYYYQSGAINESFSDLWGEFYDQTNGQGNDTPVMKWMLGEDVSGLGVRRSMSDPTNYTDPDMMSSVYYYKDEEDNGGVHTNSGVNNKAVYLMVDGGDFNGKTVSALGWTKTAAIYYHVNTNLLTSGADYSDLYYGLQTACSSLIGQKGITAADCVDVKDALDAVEMNGQPAPDFNTDAPLCAAGSVATMVFTDNLEAGTGNWTFNNGAYPRWQLDTPIGPFAQSGLHSLFADDYPDVVTNAIARLKPLAIPSGAYLHFAQAYGFESGYNTGDPTFYHFDGGVLEYSINNGATWADAGPWMDYHGYTGTLFTGAGNPLSGRSAFAGDSHGYISTRLNLSSLAGQTVIFRWRMGLDEAGYDWGWWIDNVKLYRCIPLPGAFNTTVPANGAGSVSLNPTLSWNSSSAAMSYQYCYDLINDNQCNRAWISTAGTSAPISNLGPNTTYYWQVKARNLAGTTEANSSSWSSFTTTSTLPAGITGVNAFVGTVRQGSFSLSTGQSLRESFVGVNNGPVKLASTTSTPLIGAERLIYKFGGINTSFSEVMGLPNSQLDTTYWLPWYNNVDLDTQLRFANVSASPATVTITIGGQQMGDPILLAAGVSTRVSFAGVNNGPVKIVSTQNIVAAERLIYRVNNVNTSFSEMMALPNSQLDTTYWLPWYNNVDLDTQLRFANVTDQPASVRIYIRGVEMQGSPFALLPGESTRKSFPGINSGPVQIVSDQNIVAAERLIYKVNGVNTSFSEMMGLPNSQLNTTYWLPWYNNKDLDTQLRFANVHDSQAAQVHVYIGGVEMQGSPFTLLAGESIRQSFADINSGPVQIVSDVPIVGAERLIYKVNGVNTSFSEMLALPNDQLDTTYWFPWYNNVDLDTQLRFGVP
jgi:Zn-dependent metalloprotease